MASPTARAAVRGLYGMVDTSASPQLSHLDLAQTLLQAGVSILQLRMKGAQDEEQLAVLRALAQLCAGTGA